MHLPEDCPLFGLLLQHQQIDVGNSCQLLGEQLDDLVFELKGLAHLARIHLTRLTKENMLTMMSVTVKHFLYKHLQNASCVRSAR